MSTDNHSLSTSGSTPTAPSISVGAVSTTAAKFGSNDSNYVSSSSKSPPVKGFHTSIQRERDIGRMMGGVGGAGDMRVEYDAEGKGMSQVTRSMLGFSVSPKVADVLKF